MASAPIIPAPPTLSLEDENAIRVMKSTNEKRVAKRTLAEINKAALAAKRTLAEINKKIKLAAPFNQCLKHKCKKCSLPALDGNYGFCGVMHTKSAGNRLSLAGVMLFSLHLLHLL